MLQMVADEEIRLGERVVELTDHWVAVVRPGKILFNADRVADAEGTVEPVAPLALIGIAVVGIQHWQVVIEQVKPRRLRTEQAAG